METAPEKPSRSRKGYVMVELTAEQRAKLEALRDRRQQEIGVKLGLSQVIRILILQAKD